MALILLLLWGGIPATAKAGLSFTAGLGLVHFRDSDLSDFYGRPIAPVLAVQGGTLYGLSPTLTFYWASATHVPSTRGFVARADTRMHFLPIALQFPYELRFSRHWRLRAGAQIAYAWFREEWEVVAPNAGIETRRHGTGGWVGLGFLAGIRLDLGKAGAAGIEVETLWASADRENIGGNPHGTEEMTGGWKLIRIGWSPPWPTHPIGDEVY